MPDLPPLPRVNSVEASHRIGRAPELLDPAAMEPLPLYVVAAYTLPRGSMFMPADVDHPFAFTVTVAGLRTYLVVARERGEVEWPAWLIRQRAQARGAAAVAVRRGYKQVTDWIDQSERYLQGVSLADL